MRLDVRTNEFTHASRTDLWNECTVWCDGVLIEHVIALDTEERWVMAYEPGAGWDTGRTVTHHGEIEHCRRDAFEQCEPVKRMTALRKYGAGM